MESMKQQLGLSKYRIHSIELRKKITAEYNLPIKFPHHSWFFFSFTLPVSRRYFNSIRFCLSPIISLVHGSSFCRAYNLIGGKHCESPDNKKSLDRVLKNEDIYLEDNLK